jgi:hypothetical protein
MSYTSVFYDMIGRILLWSLLGVSVLLIFGGSFHIARNVDDVVSAIELNNWDEFAYFSIIMGCLCLWAWIILWSRWPDKK